MSYADGVPDSRWSHINALVRDLLGVKATPAGIHQRYQRASEEWDKPFGPEALVKHWGLLGRLGHAPAEAEFKLGRAEQ